MSILNILLSSNSSPYLGPCMAPRLPAPLAAPQTRPMCIALTGSGGKSSLMALLCATLPTWALGVVSTTTTRIYPPNRPKLCALRSHGLLLCPQAEIDNPSFCGPAPSGSFVPRTAGPDHTLPHGSPSWQAQALLQALRVFFQARPQGHITLGQYIDSAEKLHGFSPAFLSHLFLRLSAHLPNPLAQALNLPQGTPMPSSPFWVVEADGSAGRPLKAYAKHEPQIPSCAHEVIAVAGLDALSQRLERAVHRPELAAAYLGIPLSTSVTPAIMAALLGSFPGPFCVPAEGVPRPALPLPVTRTILLNKEDAAPPGSAEAVAHLLRPLLPGFSCYAAKLLHTKNGHIRKLVP